MKKIIVVSIFSILSYSAFADVVIVVHPNNNSTFDAKSIKGAFLGKTTKFSNGQRVAPLMQSEGSDVTKIFHEKVMDKTASQFKSYWTKRLFTGKGKPPPEVSNDQAVIDKISTNPDAIGFIDSANVSDKVKVIATY
jgi:ABC-type phosphate transport system substrate-binding protein